MMGNSPVLKCQAAPKRAVRAHQEADAQSDSTTHVVANSSGLTLQDRSGDASQASLVMTWRFENIREQEVIVHTGLIALNALFATAITALAVYYLL